MGSPKSYRAKSKVLLVVFKLLNVADYFSIISYWLTYI